MANLLHILPRPAGHNRRDGVGINPIPGSNTFVSHLPTQGSDFLHLLHRHFGCRTASQVLRAGNRLQMFRVDAQGRAAKMVKVEPLRDWPNQPLIDHAMRWKSFAVDMGQSVPMPIFRSLPNPAASVLFDQELRAGATELMSRHVPNGMPFQMSQVSPGCGSDRRSFSTSAVAQSGRIWRHRHCCGISEGSHPTGPAGSHDLIWTRTRSGRTVKRLPWKELLARPAGQEWFRLKGHLLNLLYRFGVATPGAVFSSASAFLRLNYSRNGGIWK